jgi:hypothetical protein
MWYSLFLLGYRPVQNVTVLNTVGNCNTMLGIIILHYNTMGPPSYMWSVIDQNAVMWCTNVLAVCCSNMGSGLSFPLLTATVPNTVWPLTDQLQRSYSCESNSSSNNHKISHPKVHYHVHNSPPPVSILSQMNLVHLLFHFFRISFKHYPPIYM